MSMNVEALIASHRGQSVRSKLLCCSWPVVDWYQRNCLGRLGIKTSLVGRNTVRQVGTFLSVLSAAAFIGFVTMAWPAQAYGFLTPYALGGSCSGLDKMRFIVADSNAITSVANYGNVPDGRINFKSTAKGCVVITISSDVFVKDADNSLVLEAVLDDLTVCPPGDNNFAYSNSDPAADYPERGDRSMTMLCSGVPGGTHFIQLKMKSAYTGETVELGKRTLTVMYK